MFVSHRYKLFFFEVPRTASRSVTKALSLLDPMSPTALSRSIKSQTTDYHRFDGSVVRAYPDYALIAVHRNPYERVLSHYKLRKIIGNPNILKTLDFEEYIDASLGEKKLNIDWMKDKPITEMLTKERVTHWLAFDSLLSDWASLASALDVALPELPHINASKHNSHAFYTAKTAQIVSETMHEDFIYFNYDLESWQTSR
jgi:hypothetical protein